jgi:hypothetical protein
LDYNADTPAATVDTENEHADGYTFDRWSPSVAEKVTENVEYVAQWTANDDTPYTVEYYYQVNGEYPAEATSKDETRT